MYTEIELWAIALGIGGAFSRRAYWDYRYTECKKSPMFEAMDCSTDVKSDRLDSFMGL